MNHGEKMKESSLVIFSLLTQTAIGAFWMQGLVYLWATGRVGSETARDLTLPGFLAIVPLMAIALLVSLLHLGTRRNAWRAVANLGSSWLSREILFGALFAAGAAVFAGLLWWQVEPGWLQVLTWLLAAVCGGLALYSMLRIYLLRTVPAWNNWTTPAAFGISTLLLGGMSMCAAMALNPAARGDLLRLPLAFISLLSLFLLAGRLVLTALRAKGADAWLMVLHLSLLVFAMLITSLLVYQSVMFEFSGRSPALSTLAVVAFLVALTEEAVGRVLFYMSFAQAGSLRQ
jgi:anaerobic dimethyl sulfoxide reductase subunit C (anchor subunit)